MKFFSFSQCTVFLCLSDVGEWSQRKITHLGETGTCHVFALTPTHVPGDDVHVGAGCGLFSDPNASLKTSFYARERITLFIRARV